MVTLIAILFYEEGKPNYRSYNIKKIREQLIKNRLISNFRIDCSHGNSRRISENQLKICRNICCQISNGETSIVGVIIEIFLVKRKQNTNCISNTIYGKSITDDYIGWKDTKILLMNLAKAC